MACIKSNQASSNVVLRGSTLTLLEKIRSPKLEILLQDGNNEMIIVFYLLIVVTYLDNTDHSRSDQ